MAIKVIFPLLSLILLSGYYDNGELLKKYSASVDKITLPPQKDVESLTDKNPDYKEIVNWIYKKENWAKVVAAADSKLGLYYKEGITLKINFTVSDDASPASVRAESGDGYMEINLPTILAEIKKFPSIGITGILAHEYTHVIQYNKGAPNSWPLWLIEGMGCYVGGVEDKWVAAWATREPPHTLDQPIKDTDAVYAWGQLFHMYLEKKYSKEKLYKFADLLISKKKDYKLSAEEATGKKWDAIVTEQLEWAKEWINSYYKAKAKEGESKK